MNKRLNQLPLVFIAIYCLSGLNSCCECEEPVTDDRTLVDVIELGSHTVVELQALLLASGVGFSPSIIKYDVNIYKMTYHTQYKDSEVTASGIVVLPQTADPLSMLGLQHGTIVAHKDAPSAQPFLSEQMVLYSGLGSLGHIVVIPDYLGFGSTSHLLHPYYVEDLAVSSVIDNLKAAKELTDAKQIDFNENLFLAGYSQGGYVTMAVHKFIDQNKVQGFDLIASFPAAGGYNIKRVQDYVFGLETYSDPFYLPYVALSYKATFEWMQPLTDFFNEPYASALPGLFSGDLSGSEINASLPDTISVLINNDLLINIDTDPKYQYIVSALVENSLTDWVPITPMYMYHGELDVTVPYEDSVSVYQQLLANGASDDVLHLITISGANHAFGVRPYVEDVIPKIMSLDL